MESIFHEKQEGYLCAQHCLNALLQGQYFNAVDLANIASQLDADERRAMAERGEDTAEYRQFIAQPSGNMDDSGYFSVQVISKALEFCDLELIPYTSQRQEALMAQKDPSQMKAYICNYKGHWFTIRKLGNQWFNLNSLLPGPQLISDTYLAMFLAQLIGEGYSIFVVIGHFPQCEADEVLLKNPVPASKSRPNIVPKRLKFPTLESLAEDNKAQMMQAARALEHIAVPSTSRTNKNDDIEIISESVIKPRERRIPIKVEGSDGEVFTIEDDDDNVDLQKALKMSLENFEREQQSRDLQSRLEKSTNSNFNEDEDDDELRRALQLSLECVTAPSTPNQEDLRCLRLNYLMRNGQNESSTKLNT